MLGSHYSENNHSNGAAQLPDAKRNGSLSPNLLHPQIRSSLLDNLQSSTVEFSEEVYRQEQSSPTGNRMVNGDEFTEPYEGVSFAPMRSFKSSMFLQETSIPEPMAIDSLCAENINNSGENSGENKKDRGLLNRRMEEPESLEECCNLESIEDGQKMVGYVPSAYQVKLSSGNCLPISKRYKLKSETTEKNIMDPSNSSLSRSAGTFYGIPIHDLLYSIRQENSFPTENAKLSPISKNPSIQKESKKNTDHSLLSEKYRPKKWVDLVGPEKTHRHMLRWLVAWSKVVFGGDDEKIASSEINNLDLLGRPIKKVLLLHGAPGIGKTTVAHLMAKQCGYDVMEINASDERAATIVKDKINSAIGSHRINSSKPVCIIADEIEGASENGFIKAIVDMLVGDEKALAAKFNKTSEKSSKRNKKSKLMLRPIIAICNDVYAPSLRTLRPHVEIVNYTRTPQPTLMLKLKDICQIERIPWDTKTLSKIIDTSNGDLRSCLNMLQFGFRDSLEHGSFKKDVNQNWVKVTNRLFRKSGTSESLRDLLQDLDSSGEQDRVVNGCFTLYPRINFIDDMVQKPGLIGDWMYFYEQINSGIYGSQNSQLADYLSPIALSYHIFCSSPSNIKEERINSDYEIYEKGRTLSELCHDVWTNLATNLKQLFSAKGLNIELVPYLLNIVNSEIASSSQLKPGEVQRIAQVASLMLDMKINFLKDKLESGSLIYRLDPPLESIAIIEETLRQKHTVGKYSMRQLLIQAMHKERVVRTKRSLENASGGFNFANMNNDKSNSMASSIDESQAKKPKLEPKKKRTNFFVTAPSLSNNKIDFKDNDVSLVEPQSEPQNERVWVQYIEGFSNAVRKDITWLEFIKP